MDNNFFVLNDRYSVDTSLNLLINIESGLHTRLEPRLINILHILAKNEGKLVSRETLIAEIWNNYGGAEDALNQGISILRRALADTDKQMIETVPKKGYILHAGITYDLPAIKTVPGETRSSKRPPVLIAILLGIVILLSVFIFKTGRNNNKENPATKPSFFIKEDAIVSKNWRGKNYKLLVEKNDDIVLYENNARVADSNLVHYEVIIQELKDKFTSNQDAAR